MEYNKKLVLADGTVFPGNGFGANEEVVAEVIFHTGMTGYEGILTDAAYHGQMVVMTYPMIGNYGMTADDCAATTHGASALIVKEHCEVPSNWRSVKSLDGFMVERGIVGICDVDTRALSIKIRQDGTMKGIIVDASTEDADAIAKLNSVDIKNHVATMAITESFKVAADNKKFRVVMVAFDTKKDGIIDELLKRDCEIIGVPYTTSFDEIAALNPDGIVVGNGPGNPLDVPEILPTIKALQEKYPVFAVNLGHQLFALANGATTSKMKFGHHGGNVPVKDVTTGRTLITAQNHLYHVEKESLNGTDLELTHYALNDGTIQGVKHKDFKAFSVQFLPEVHTGPADAQHLFDQFVASLGGNQ